MLQLHKTNNLFTSYKDHIEKQEHASNVTSTSCTMSTNDPLWKHLYWRSLQDLHTSLPGQVTLQLGKGISINCEVLQDVRLIGLWLRSSYGSSSAKHLSHIDFASVKHICVLQSPCCWTAPGIEHNSSFDLSGDVVCFKHILKNQNNPWTQSLFSSDTGNELFN